MTKPPVAQAAAVLPDGGAEETGGFDETPSTPHRLEVRVERSSPRVDTAHYGGKGYEYTVQ